MTILNEKSAPIRRPKILLQAARICARGYSRDRMLPRLLGASSARVVAILSVQEERLEQERRMRESTYSAQAHVEVLSALIAERKNAA